eukprot:gene32197-16743_t
MAPGKPKNLKVSGQDRKALLSWDPPDNGGCIDTYLIDVYVDGAAEVVQSITIYGLNNDKKYNFVVRAHSQLSEAAVSSSKFFRGRNNEGAASTRASGIPSNLLSVSRASSFRSSPFDGPSSTDGACVNVSRLTNDMKYEFTIAPWTARHGDGVPTSITSTPGTGARALSREGWRCKALPGCRPGGIQAAICALSSCAALAKIGFCKGPLMYDLDFSGQQACMVLSLGDFKPHAPASPPPGAPPPPHRKQPRTRAATARPAPP